MKWSWKIGRFAGIDVFIHATFFLILVYVGWSYYAQGSGLTGALKGILFLLAIFLSVVLHEYGHALTARRYGIKTRDITLYPIGGVARLERMPDKPLEELAVALAGPAVNVVIAVALFVWLMATNAFDTIGALSITGGSFLERLLTTNLFLAGFNLLPAFPMDGGRVLRALLALKLEYTRATQIAANIGQGVALLFGLIGLTNNPLLVFIAFFVWIGAAQEASLVQMKSSLGGIPVSRAMLTNFDALAETDPLSRAVELLLEGYQQDFPVVSEGRVTGILTRNDLVKTLNQQPAATPVSSVMQREFLEVHPGDMLETLFMRLQECKCHTAPVTRNGELVGLVTSENIGEFLMVQSALKKRDVSRIPTLPG